MPRPVGLVDERPGCRNLLVDHRGITLPLLNVADLPPDAPELVSKAVKLANMHRWWPQFRTFATTFAVILALSFGINYVWTVKANPCIWWICVFAISWRMGAYGGKRKVYDNAVHAYTLCLAAGVCPSCGYRIEGVPRQEDGATVCPECAGAWDTRINASPPAASAGVARQRPASGSGRRA